MPSIADDLPILSLRRATETDVAAIRDLVDAAYGKYVELIGRTPIPMLTDHALAVEEHDVWVVEDDARIVGVIELAARADHLWIENVAVDPRWQGRGIGRRLLAHAENEARRLSLAELRLLTNERYLANIAMYTHYGYRETHREPHLGTDLVYFSRTLEEADMSAGEAEA
jgi:N-acetylglutamate synthase-like GNAT family acetyltransferase